MKNQEWREPEPRVVESQSQTRNVAVSVRGRPVVIECCRDTDVRSCSVEPGRTGVGRVDTARHSANHPLLLALELLIVLRVPGTHTSPKFLALVPAASSLMCSVCVVLRTPQVVPRPRSLATVATLQRHPSAVNVFAVFCEGLALWT